MIETVPCNECGGMGFHTVTHEMAIDAGDLQLSGTRYPCNFCGGNGYFEIEVDNA